MQFRGVGPCVGLFLLVSSVFATDSTTPVVPEGFTIEKAVGAPLIQRPIFAAFDEDGLLFVGESNGENLKRDDMLAKKPHWISRLEDTDSDGVFDKSVKFVEGITLPQGMLCYRGSVYAACPPSIWKFTDTDGDGKADTREEILTGFGFSGNACDTHGPFLSPTGRLYIAQGRHGHEFRDKEGKTYSKGKAARIYSCRLDGSDVRVHCGGGFDNPVEIDFTEEGEAIGTVNILYRDRGDCLMHWVEGGVYPREDQADCVAEFKWTGGLLGPIHNLGHVACSGLMRYRGVHFGDAFKDRWFFTEFNTHKVRYAELKRSGSTFTADVHEFLTSSSPDFHPTDVLEDADGSLLVVDTGAWFLNGCPTSRVSKPEDLGAIWRIRKTGGTKLDDPRGKTLELAKQKPEVWVKHLDDVRPAVAAQAVDQFGRNGRSDGLGYLSATITDREQPVSRRRRAVWGLARLIHVKHINSKRLKEESPETELVEIPGPLSRPDYSLFDEAILGATGDPDWSVQQAAACLLGWTEGPLIAFPSLLNTNVPQLRRQLAEASSLFLRTNEVQFADDPEMYSLLGDLLGNQMMLLDAERGIADRCHEHAVTYAMICSGVTEPRRLKDRPAPVARVRLIALDQMDDSPLTREMVVPLLSTDDPALLAAVLEVISRREGWGAETLSLFKEWLKEGELSAERLTALRGFLAAQVRDPKAQQFIGDAFGGWALLPDRSTDAAKNEDGRARVPNLRRTLIEIVQHAAVDAWPDVWNKPLLLAFADGDAEVRQRAFETVQARGLIGFDEQLHKIASDDARSLEDRMLATAAFAPREKDTAHCDLAGLQVAIAQEDASPVARLNAAKALAALPLDNSQLINLTKRLGKLQPMELKLVLPAFARSTNENVGLRLVEELQKQADSANVGPDELAAILRKYPAPVQQAGVPLLKKLGVDPEAQRLKLEELAPLLDEGDAKAGQAIFAGKKANCAACHQVGGQGGRIGPDLTKIAASRTPRDLLEAIVYPSASFVNGYRPYIVVTEAGKTHTGVISSESTDTITLKLQDLTEVRVPRKEIDELKEGTVSIMPKGLDTQLTPDELRNLLAYLRARK